MLRFKIILDEHLPRMAMVLIMPGWGNQFVMGGAVKGGNIFGQYPDLYIDNPLDVGKGRLIPTTASDQYFAELALWFGVPRSELDMVLPNIGTFYGINEIDPPMGFLL